MVAAKERAVEGVVWREFKRDLFPSPLKERGSIRWLVHHQAAFSGDLEPPAEGIGLSACGGAEAVEGAAADFRGFDRHG
jgi:hypothetical protein